MIFFAVLQRGPLASGPGMTVAPRDAQPADLFRAAFHCHDDGPHPRTSDRFDAAPIWRTERTQQI